MMLHQGEHVYIHTLKDSNMLDIMYRWMEHYLKGVDNGIEKEPAVLVESGSDQSVWMASDTWPPKGWEAETFPISETGEGVIVDDLSRTVYDRSADNLGEWLDELVLNEDAEYKNRLKYIWDPFAEKGTSAHTKEAGENIRISGTVKVSFDAAIDRET